MNNSQDFIAPDIETASEGYRTRFAGEVGKYLLCTQAKAIMSLMPASGKKLRILEVGGGHAQLVENFLAEGHEVWVQGSNSDALIRIRQLEHQYNESLHPIESPLDSLPFEDKFFDVVVNVRVTAHLSDLAAALKEWTRLCRSRLIFDYPPLESFNLLYPVLFRLKKMAEKNTRVFEIYRTANIKSALAALNWRIAETKRQFFFPMVVHRALKNVSLSEKLEHIAASAGATSILGSPAVIAAEPNP